MDAEQLEHFILSTVEAEPVPPRFVDRGALLVHCTLNVASGVIIFCGVATLVIVAQFSFTGRLAPGQASSISAFHIVMGGLGLGLAVLPFLTFARMSSVLRNGVLTTARIVDIEAADRPDAPRTAPGTHVVGTRIVDHHLGPYEERFSSDAVFAAVLVPGVEVGVLVHPHRPQVLRDLRPLR